MALGVSGVTVREGVSLVVSVADTVRVTSFVLEAPLPLSVSVIVLVCDSVAERVG